MISARNGHCLEAGVDVEGAEHRADVVAHGLGAEVKAFGDLVGRAAVLEQP